MKVSYPFLCVCLTVFCATISQNMGFAATFPRGCEAKDYKFENGGLTLNETGEQRLYLVYNHAPETIELRRHQTSDTFMSPSLSVKLAPNGWAAFASDISYMSFDCHVNAENNVRKIDCHQALDVCQYPRAKFALSNMGNYWISANKSQYEVIRDAANKGIYLHW